MGDNVEEGSVGDNDLRTGKGAFGDTGAFYFERYLVDLQAAFVKGGPAEVDLFIKTPKYNGDKHEEVAGSHDLTVGEFITPLYIRLARDGSINFHFTTAEAINISIRALDLPDNVPTVFEALAGWSMLEHGRSITTAMDENKRVIGQRLPIVRRLNETLEHGDASVGLSAQQRNQEQREEFYKKREDTGMF
jgi:hypothetical protein